MSRTYRFKKDKWMIKDCRILFDYVWDTTSWTSIRTPIDPKSNRGRTELARFHSDAKRGVMLWKGPMWFHNMYAQRPYRRDCKRQIKKLMSDADYEIQIKKKPYREYWD